MKKPTYFIASSDFFGELLAAEVVTTLREHFVAATGFGHGGGVLPKTGIEILDASLGDHDSNSSFLAEQVLRREPQVAIFCGFAPQHNLLAERLALARIPAVLLPLTPGWRHKDLAFLQYVQHVCSLFKNEGPPDGYETLGWTHVGCPFKEWTSKVQVTPRTLDLPDAPRVVLAMGRPGGLFAERLEHWLAAAKLLVSALPSCKVILPVAEEHAWQHLASQFGVDASSDRFVHEGIHFFRGMVLETLSLADVALCDEGTASIEAVMAAVPAVALKNNSHVAANLLDGGGKLLPEFPLSDPMAAVDAVVSLCKDEERRHRQQKVLQNIREGFDSFAADHVAEVIGKTAGWDMKRRRKRAGYE